MKPLSSLSLEALYQLFPIELKPYNESYKTQYLKEETLLKSLLKEELKTIYHIGSTAILSIVSKPIVDILILLKEEANENKTINKLKEHGYLLMRQADNPFAVSFNKGYTPNGYESEVYHIHIRKKGIDEVIFRDKLNSDLKLAKAYEALKEALLLKHGLNRDLYTEGKTDFVKYVLKLKQDN